MDASLAVLYRRLYDVVYLVHVGSSSTPTTSGARPCLVSGARSQLARLSPTLACPETVRSQIATWIIVGTVESRIASRGRNLNEKKKRKDTTRKTSSCQRVLLFVYLSFSLSSSLSSSFPSVTHQLDACSPHAAARQRPVRSRPRSRAACVRISCVAACVTTTVTATTGHASLVYARIYLSTSGEMPTSWRHACDGIGKCGHATTHG